MKTLIKDIVIFATLGVCIFTAWKVAGSYGRESHAQHAIVKTRMKAINAPAPGEDLLVHMNGAFGNRSCSLEINTYAIPMFDGAETFPLGYIKHPKEFLEQVQNEEGLTVPFKIPSTAQPGIYSLLIMANYNCNAVQRLSDSTFKLNPIQFEVKGK